MRGSDWVRETVWNEGRRMTDRPTGYQRVPLHLSPVRANARRYEQDRRVRKKTVSAVVLAFVLMLAAAGRVKGERS